MQKVIFDINGLERDLQYKLKRSLTVQETTNHYTSKLQSFKTKTITDRPFIVIDNGSFECRAGWSFEENPYLRFRNFVGKPKTSVNKVIDSLHLVGDELNEIDANKVGKRSMFDRNVVYHIQSLEHMLDYTFSHLGLAKDNQIEYPLLMTEAMCNPNFSRSLVSELLFECYRLPAVNYSVDSLLSFYYNSQQRSQKPTTGLIINSSHSSTHIVPVIDSQWQLPLTRRINLGGASHTELLQKSLQLRYPQFKQNLLQTELVQQVKETHTAVAFNYSDQIKYLQNVYQEEQRQARQAEQIRRDKLMGKEPEIKSQTVNHFIYKGRHQKRDCAEAEAQICNQEHILQLSWTLQELPNSEELKRRQEQRQQLGQKLKEINLKKKADKRRQMETELADLNSLASLQPKELKEELEQRQIEPDQYEKRIKILQVKLGIQQEAQPKFDLLDQADEFLTPEQLKQKRIQKMHKTAQEIRAKKKAEKQIEQERIAVLKQQDPEAYLGNLYEQRRLIIEKMQERANKKLEVSKRGSKAAHRRMQVLAELGIEEKQSLTNDNFGQDDEDWDVYREIQKDDGGSEEEEENQVALQELEDQIAEMDPKFGLLLYNSTKMPTEEDYQIKLSTERYRGSETLFQPSIVGLECEGITEILENIINQMGDSQQKRKMLEYVLLSGGNTLVQGFDQRVKQELTMMNPVSTAINVVRAFDAELDAWRGGAMFVNKVISAGDLPDYSISRAAYEECGHHYLKEHSCSNYLYGQKQSRIPQVEFACQGLKRQRQ